MVILSGSVRFSDAQGLAACPRLSWDQQASCPQQSAIFTCQFSPYKGGRLHVLAHLKSDFKKISVVFCISDDSPQDLRRIVKKNMALLV